MPGQRSAVTDREKLQMAIRCTVQWEFGQLCDRIDELVQNGTINQYLSDSLKAQIRTRGNNIIRVSSNHCDSYNVTKIHKSPVNAKGIADRIQEEG